MKKIFFSLVLSIKVSFCQGITIFGGLNQSTTNSEVELIDGYERVFNSGFNFGLEKKIGPTLVGLGLNQRGSQTNLNTWNESFKTRNEGFNRSTLNYLTLHGLYSFDLKDNITGFCGIQLGQFNGGELRVETEITHLGVKETSKFLEPIIDEKYKKFDYGIVFGAQYWLTEKIGLRSSYYMGLADIKGSASLSTGNRKNVTTSFSLIYGIGRSGGKSSFFSGPSASVSNQGGSGGIERPGATGSPEIDNFVNATFDLNDKIVDLKEKVQSVSSGLAESNTILTEIGESSSGPMGWASNQLVKGFSKSKNSIITAAQSIKSDVPNLPEVYFGLIKESMTDPNTLKELLKGTQPEEALLLTFNKKAKEKGVPTTSKEWIKDLNLELDPTKALKTKLGKINDGIIGGKDKLVSVPDDLKGIGTQAQSLLSSAGELPKAAKSLGMRNAPKALKAIKNTSGVLKNIPNEVKSIGDETKKVVDQIDQVLKNIQNILSSN